MKISVQHTSDVANGMIGWMLNCQEVVKEYQGAPIYFVITGAGMGLTDLMKIPGSSKMVGEMIIPYGEASSLSFTSGCDALAVTEEKTLRYYEDAKSRACMAEFNTPVVIVNGALTTNRYRRGKNHAYIIVNEKMYHVEFPQRTEEEWNKINEAGFILGDRLAQDITVSDIVLSLIMGIFSEEDYEGLTFTEVCDVV
jgi:hypothetical protein